VESTPTAVAPTPRPPAPGRRGRRPAAVLAAVAVLAAAGVAVAMARGGDSDAEPEPAPPALFAPTSYVVTYEVTGDSTVEEIQMVIGAGNKLEKVDEPKLPFSREVRIDVGSAGGTALINASNTGTGKLACTVKVDGQPAFQAAGQNQTDVSCSATLPAKVVAQ
jgi:hypothetical protein